MSAGHAGSEEALRKVPWSEVHGCWEHMGVRCDGRTSMDSLPAGVQAVLKRAGNHRLLPDEAALLSAVPPRFIEVWGVPEEHSYELRAACDIHRGAWISAEGGEGVLRTAGIAYSCSICM